MGACWLCVACDFCVLLCIGYVLLFGSFCVCVLLLWIFVGWCYGFALSYFAGCLHWVSSVGFALTGVCLCVIGCLLGV